MDQGVIRQVGTPTEIYEYPASRFVADFIGSINQFEGEVIRTGGGMTDVSCPVLAGTVKAAADATPERGSKVTLAVRPEKITITREAPRGGANVVAGRRCATSAISARTRSTASALPSGHACLGQQRQRPPRR